MYPPPEIVSNGLSSRNASHFSSVFGDPELPPLTHSSPETAPIPKPNQKRR